MCVRVYTLLMIMTRTPVGCENVRPFYPRFYGSDQNPEMRTTLCAFDGRAEEVLATPVRRLPQLLLSCFICK